jgi:hypothetical protein
MYPSGRPYSWIHIMLPFSLIGMQFTVMSHPLVPM